MGAERSRQATTGGRRPRPPSAPADRPFRPTARGRAAQTFRQRGGRSTGATAVCVSRWRSVHARQPSAISTSGSNAGSGASAASSPSTATAVSLVSCRSHATRASSTDSGGPTTRRNRRRPSTERSAVGPDRTSPAPPGSTPQEDAREMPHSAGFTGNPLTTHLIFASIQTGRTRTDRTAPHRRRRTHEPERTEPPDGASHR